MHKLSLAAVLPLLFCPVACSTPKPQQHVYSQFTFVPVTTPRPAPTEPPGPPDPLMCAPNADNAAYQHNVYTFGFKIGEAERRANIDNQKRHFREALRESVEALAIIDQCSIEAQSSNAVLLAMPSARARLIEAEAKIGLKDATGAALLLGQTQSDIDAFVHAPDASQSYKNLARDLMIQIRHDMAKVNELSG